MPDESYSAEGTRFGDFIERLNRRLRPYLGGSQLGPPNEPALVAPEHGGACPLCALPMDEHVVDRSGTRTMLHCPVLPNAVLPPNISPSGSAPAPTP